MQKLIITAALLASVTAAQAMNVGDRHGGDAYVPPPPSLAEDAAELRAIDELSSSGQRGYIITPACGYFPKGMIVPNRCYGPIN